MTPTLENPGAQRSWHTRVVDVLGADLRSLALFRIVLAALVLADLTNRATDLTAHYTDGGVLPRTVLLEKVLSPWSFSLNLMNGAPFFQALLFCLAAVAALCLLVGYRTRLATVVVWVLMFSIQSRNPLVDAHDATLLRMLLFWGMFLPLGAHWSVDRVLKAAPARLSMRFFSLATVGLSMQIAFMYWFAAVLKSGPEWRVDGTALYYALSADQYVEPIGAYLLQFPALLKVLTFGTIALEAFGPFLLFCPVLTGPVRTGAVMAFMGFHFGIWLTMDVGMFPYISAFCMVWFLPGWFWDKVVPKLRGVFPSQMVIARYLQRMIRLVHTWWLPLRARLSPVRSVGLPSSSADLAGYGDHWPGGAPASTLPAPPSNRGESWAAVAQRGTRHGGAGASEPTVMLRSSLVTNLLAAFFLLYIFCWNLSTVSAFEIPERLVPLGTFSGVDQVWGMFAPRPPNTGGWTVIPGTLRGGQQVDLIAVTRDDYHPREGVSLEKPRHVAAIYKNRQWLIYLEALIMGEEWLDLRRHFNSYICREWNARHTGDEQLVAFRVAYVVERTQPDYRRPTLQKEILWKHSCF